MKTFKVGESYIYDDSFVAVAAVTNSYVIITYGNGEEDALTKEQADAYLKPDTRQVMFRVIKEFFKDSGHDIPTSSFGFLADDIWKELCK